MPDVPEPAAEPAADAWGPHADALPVRALRASLREARPPHALLVAGPEGIGKRALAISFAQALVCQSPAPPCLRCRPCLRIWNPQLGENAHSHADLEIVQPGGLCDIADHNHPQSVNIRICQIRRLERLASIKPFEGSVRIIIIDPAERITADASDAFLKTLEEPPEGVHFILISSRERQLSETIRSRCRLLQLAPLKTEAIRRWLADQSAGQPGDQSDEAARAELANLARGRLGWLERALRQDEPVGTRAAQIAHLVQLAESGAAARLEAAEQFAPRGPAGPEALQDLDQLLDAWSQWFRDLWLEQLGRPAPVVHQTRLDALQNQAPRYSAHDICAFLNRVQRTRSLLRRGANPRLALETALLQLPRPVQ